MRGFIVLVSRAGREGMIDIVKPQLVRESGTRIDACHRYLDPLRDALIDMPSGDEGSPIGLPWLEDLEYLPGERATRPGIVRGQITGPGQLALASGRGVTIDIPIDEIRRLTTVPGILLYLRLRAELAQIKRPELVMRMTVEDVHNLLGDYCAAAVSKKQNRQGDIQKTLSLSRVTATLLEPAVEDIARAADDFTIALHVAKPADAGRGKPWAHIDVQVTRLVKRKLAGPAEPKPHIHKMQAFGPAGR